MIKAENKEMIEFLPITTDDKQLFEAHLEGESERGCEVSFANLYLWGRQSFAEMQGHILVFSQFNRRSVYPYPLGSGDKKAVLDAIIADSRARGIPCRITGLGATARATVEELYPDMFRFHTDEDSFDYVYAIDDLADLKGKKYHGKRNHIHRFDEAFPDYRVEPITEENLPRVKKMAENWYEERIKENPNGDHHMERAALNKAFAHMKELEMDGIALTVKDEVIAFTMGSRMYGEYYDVNFEKAVAGADGAYAKINCEFAKYIRNKYPDIKYLDREEDMGLEGLRKAKKSYHPHHQIEKCWACLLEEGYEY